MEKISTIKVLLIGSEYDAGVTEEFKNIREIAAKSDCPVGLKTEVIHSLNPGELFGAIWNMKPEIVHFSGHGTADHQFHLNRDCSDGCGMMKEEQLVALLKSLPASVECVVFNACFTEQYAKAVSEQITYAIAMQREVGAEASIAFSKGFYRAICEKHSTAQAFEEAKQHGIKENSMKERFMPVLEKKSLIRSVMNPLYYHFIAPQTTEPQESNEKAKDIDKWQDMVMFLLHLIVFRLLENRFLAIFISLFCIITTGWLMMPVLDIPLNNQEVRLWATVKYGIATIVIPILVTIVTPLKLPHKFTDKATKRKALVIKHTGAMIGFFTLSIPLIFLLILRYELLSISASREVRVIFSVIPLLFSYLAARRLPYDMYNEEAGTIKLKTKDQWMVFFIFLVMGPISSFFLYYKYSFLTDLKVLFLVLTALIAVVLWSKRDRPNSFIWIVGVLIPLLMFAIILFLIIPPIELFDSHESIINLMILLICFLSESIICAIIAIKKNFNFTMHGALSFLAVVITAGFFNKLNPWLGPVIIFGALSLWGLLPRSFIKEHLWVHWSFFALQAGIITVVILLTRGLISYWHALIFCTLISGFLISAAYKARHGDVV